MPTLGQAEKKLRDGWDKEEGSLNEYVQILRRFHHFTGSGAWKSSDVERYLRGLSETLSPVSVRKYYWAMSGIFDRLDISFDLTLKSLQLDKIKLKAQSVHTPEEIAKMVKYVRSEGEIDEMFFLAMSTVYGVRREELSRIWDTDFKFTPEGNSVLIHTAKHGPERETMIPDEIHGPISIGLANIIFPVSVTSLSYIYNQIIKHAGVKKQPNSGWHTIRRALDTDLIDAGLGERIIANYFRWAEGAQAQMTGRYYTIRSLQRIDQQVFAVHPYLEFWR